MRGRALTVALACVLGLVVTSGLLLERSLRQELVAEAEVELLRAARAGAVAVERADLPESVEAMDELADSLGRAASARATIVAADGTVLGDSDLDLAEVRAVESHGGRPEVREALSGGRGSSRRYSRTIGTDMLYVAVPFVRSGSRGVVRVSMPLDAVDRAVWRLRGLLATAGLAGLLVALVAGGVASHLTTARLRSLVDHARRVSAGERGVPSAAPADDEVGRLAGSFDRLARELDHAVEGLAAERDRLATILEGMNEAVLALGPDDRITLVNPAALELLGLEADPTGRPLLDVVRAPDLAELVAKCTAEGARAELVLPGTRERRVVARAARLRSGAGSVVGLRDVTERRRLEKVRQDFVANVSHELRTPVSVIVANTETLLGGALTDREHAQRFVEAIDRNGRRLAQLVNDLLDLSRLESGKFDVRRVQVPVGEAVKRAFKAVHHIVEERGLTLSDRVPEGLTVLADPTALDVVLQNLVVNAAKHGRDEGAIEVAAREEGDEVVLEVRDDGPGIPPQHRERVFERFFRVDPGRSAAQGGTGLGLAITRHLVDAMGGSVSAHDNRPRGALLRVRLPRAV